MRHFKLIYWRYRNHKKIKINHRKRKKKKGKHSINLLLEA